MRVYINGHHSEARGRKLHGKGQTHISKSYNADYRTALLYSVVQ